MNMQTAGELASWIEKESAKIRYGDIILKISIHSGKQTKFEKTITTRECEGTTAEAKS